MNRNNNNPQMPANQPQGQVPDNRIDQMAERLRQLELQNAQLRATVDYVKQGPQAQTAPKPSAFKPEVDQAIRETVQAIVAPMETQYRQQIGYLADQLDAQKFQANYQNPKFEKFIPQVEQLRQQELAQGRYVTREDALKMVYFEETGKKNVEPQVQPNTNAPPVFDPYFGTMVDPQTGRPVQNQNSGFAPEEQVDQNAPQQEQFAPQYQQQIQPQQQQVPQGVGPGARQNAYQGNHPHGNAYGQNFQLPNQGMNAQATPSYQQPNARQALNLESSDADLQAFENNFGDIPL